MSSEFLNFILDCLWLIQLSLVLGLKDRELARHRQTPGFDPKHKKGNIPKVNVKTQLILLHWLYAL